MRFIAVLLVLIAAACQTVDTNVTGGTAVSAPNLSSDHPIQWERRPDAVVFRADVAGGSTLDPFLIQNEIPFCTVYGDNRVVWTNELEDSQTEVLWDIVTDDAIRGFVQRLVVDEAIYSYRNPPPDPGDFDRPGPVPTLDPTEAARIINPNDDTQNYGGLITNPIPPTPTIAPTATQQVITEPQPSVEEILMTISGESMKIDGFSGWENGYFRRVLDACKTISTSPVLYEPSAGWVSVRAVEYDSTVPLHVWDSETSGLSLSELAESGEPRWIEGANAVTLWNVLRTTSPNLIFLEGDGQYQVALQVPGISRVSPPAGG